jgi:hypothetical protein
MNDITIKLASPAKCLNMSGEICAYYQIVTSVISCLRIYFSNALPDHVDETRINVLPINKFIHYCEAFLLSLSAGAFSALNQTRQPFSAEFINLR